MTDEEMKTKRRNAVRTAIILAVIAIGFFAGSFFFLPG
jgi:hypothetical protein